MYYHCNTLIESALFKFFSPFHKISEQDRSISRNLHIFSEHFTRDESSYDPWKWRDIYVGHERFNPIALTNIHTTSLPLRKYTVTRSQLSAEEAISHVLCCVTWRSDDGWCFMPDYLLRFASSSRSVRIHSEWNFYPINFIFYLSYHRTDTSSR